MPIHVPQFKLLDTPDDALVFQNCVNVCSKMKLKLRNGHELEITDVVVHVDNEKGEKDDVFESRLTRKNGCWSVKLEDREERQFVQYIDINISSGGVERAYRLNGLKNLTNSKITAGSSNAVKYFQNEYGINVGALDARQINETEELKIITTSVLNSKSDYIPVPRYSPTFRVNKEKAVEMAFKPYRVVRSDLLKDLIREDHEHIVYLSLLAHNSNGWSPEEVQARLGVTPRKADKWVAKFLEGLESSLDSFKPLMVEGKLVSKFDQCRLYGAWCEKYLKRAA